MKVIGISNEDGHSTEYICTIKHDELEKFMGLYFGNLDILEVGDDINLGAGYDHARQIKQAYESIQILIKDNAVIVNAILNGLNITKILEQQEVK